MNGPKRRHGTVRLNAPGWINVCDPGSALAGGRQRRSLFEGSGSPMHTGFPFAFCQEARW